MWIDIKTNMYFPLDIKPAVSPVRDCKIISL